MTSNATSTNSTHPKRNSRRAEVSQAPAASTQPQEAEFENEEEAPRRNWWTWVAIWSMPAWLLSLIVHFFGVTVLVVATLSPPPVPQALDLVATNDEASEELENMEIEFEPELQPEMEMEMAAPQLMSESFELTALTPDASMMSEAVSVDALMPSKPADFAGMDPNGLMSEISGMGEDVGKMAKFFGTGANGQRICFLVDNSNSMTGGRMETALIELNKAIEKLAPTQKFYIIFYSDTGYPLYYPSPATEMVNANTKNKKLVEQWLKTIQMCLRTDGRDAVSLALQMKPDLIYILGDGAFTDGSDVELAKTKIPGVTIHTLGMQVKPGDAQRFTAVAKTHGGTYKDVGITAEGKELLKMNGPIQRNSKRNGIWGIKLKK